MKLSGILNFRILTGPEMSTLRGSKNYVWDTTKPLGQGATSMVYVGREKVGEN